MQNSRKKIVILDEVFVREQRTKTQSKDLYRRLDLEGSITKFLSTAYSQNDTEL